MDFSHATILCLGDVMLDRFAYCDSERISPEAPVPVLLLNRSESMLGGAGNVARNIAALGGCAMLIGLVGRDAAGTELAALIAHTHGIVDRHVPSARRPTVCKTRYISGHQQLLRVDEESTHALAPEEEAALIAASQHAIGEADAVILSDYGKSVLGPKVLAAAIARAREAGIPVFVDPKGEDFSRYRGATCITPNQKELALAARLPTGSDEEIAAAARKVMQEAETGAILATRSEKGMALVEADGGVHFEGTRAREVYDVSGAGDTVIAVLAIACASGYTLPQAMRLANTAAGIVVSKLGTATVELDELMLELSRDVRDKEWHEAKYYSLSEAETLVRRWKGRGLKVGFTNGCFDIVHAGHVALLSAARAQCDRLVVALNGDLGVRRLKGPSRPLNGLADRSAVIAAIEAVDAVISFDEETPIDLIRRLQPDVLVKGGDYTVAEVVGAPEVQATGGKVVLVDLVKGRSTSRLIDAIRARPRRRRLMLVITGGGGFIGSVLGAALNEAGRTDLVIVDRFGSDDKWRNIAKRDFAEILSPDLLFAWLDRHGDEVDAIFHLGANSSTTERDADHIIATNLNYSIAVWRWCAAQRKKLIYASSAATYGDGAAGFDDAGGIPEYKRLQPLNLYGWSKHAFDLWAMREVASGRAPPFWVGLKFFNVFGPNEQHKGDMTSLVAKNWRQIATGEPVKLFKSHRPDYADGEQRRDFVYVKDCAAVMLWLWRRDVSAGINGIYNLGTGEPRTFLDLINATGTALGVAPKIEFIDIPPAIRPSYQYFTEAKMARLRQAGYNAPFTSLEDAVRDTVALYAGPDPYL